MVGPSKKGALKTKIKHPHLVKCVSELCHLRGSRVNYREGVFRVVDDLVKITTEYPGKVLEV